MLIAKFYRWASFDVGNSTTSAIYRSDSLFNLSVAVEGAEDDAIVSDVNAK